MTDHIKPMLVSEIPGHRDRIKSAGHVFVQPKLAGWCCMANTRTRKIYTRTGHEITTLPHINAALPVSGPEWLHGELYTHGRTEAEIQSMIKRGSGEIKGVKMATQIEFHVFDCVSGEPFNMRNERILKLETNDSVFTVPTIKGVPHTQIKAIYDAFLKLGYEGIIIRLDGHGYRSGRSINVFKMKPGTEVI